MNSVNEDLDDSALCSLSLFQKRKASGSVSQKKSKQAKLDFIVTSDDSEKKQSDNFDDSTSTYFNRKSICPLCLKVLQSEPAFITHTKSCAKKHKMTTQELVKALELQKKQIKERKEFGLSSEVVPWSRKNVKKTDKNKDSYDVALGIALSRSLEENKLEKGSATLEEFGFKTNQISTRILSRRNKLLQKSVLKERTVEDRERIITEKVAVILLDEDEEDNVGNKISSKMGLKTELGNIVNVVSHLWNLGQIEGKFDWYVKEIKPLILTDDEKASEKNTPEKTPGTCLINDIQDAINKLNLPSEKLSTNWRKMINSSNFSDLTATSKDSQIIYLHSLVLHTRCPNILEKDYAFIFEKFNLLTASIFLEFVYCGTLNTLIGSEVNNLLILAGEFDYEELINVLNSLETSEEAEVTIIESNRDVASYAEDKDLFVEDMVDLTQSSHSPVDEKAMECESNEGKSYWSFIQEEKKREEELRKEEEKENSLLSIERDKIDTNMKQRDELMQKIMECEEEADFRDSLELEKICGSQTFSPVDEVKRNVSECILLSSDSETRTSRPELESPELKIPSPILDYEVPCFDPYDDLIPTLSPVDSHSESLISGNISREFQEDNKIDDERKTYCSTPLSNRRNSKAQHSNKPPKKRRSDLSASRIIRKSLNLQPRRKSSIGKRKSLKRKGAKEGVEVLSVSALHELSTSFTSQTSKSIKNFTEMTPIRGKDEFGESVTPSPNYSKMEDSMIKEHLARYGLKRSLPKTKAKKILRHIYDELHPRLNTETGKIIKILPSDKPTKKIKPKSKKAAKRVTKKKSAEVQQKSANSSEQTLKASDESTDGSGGEFEELNETLTQITPNNALDLPSAFCEFLEKNSDFHKKILEYEPIWLEDLQSRLKEMFKKHFKLSDLMDYLDQKCITFRSEAQKRVNQKRKDKKSPRKNSR